MAIAFSDTGLEFPEIREFVPEFKCWLENRYGLEISLDIVKPKLRFDEVIKKYGYPVINKEVAKYVEYARKGSLWAINGVNGQDKYGQPCKYKQRYTSYKYLVDAPFNVSDKCCNHLKISPLESYEKLHKTKPIVATMAEEGKRRLDGWLRLGCNGIGHERARSMPMAFWLEQDILRYLMQFNIPYASVYGDIVEEKGRLKTTMEQRTGCMFCMFGVHMHGTNKFQRMRLTHPKQYGYCIRPVEDGGLGLGRVLDYIGVKYV